MLKLNEKKDLKLGQTIKYQIINNGKVVEYGKGKVMNKVVGAYHGNGNLVLLGHKGEGLGVMYPIQIPRYLLSNVVIGRARFPKEDGDKLNKYIEVCKKDNIDTGKWESDFNTEDRDSLAKEFNRIQENLDYHLEQSLSPTLKTRNILRYMRWEITPNLENKYVKILIEPADDVRTKRLLTEGLNTNLVNHIGDLNKAQDKANVEKLFKYLGYNLTVNHENVMNSYLQKNGIGTVSIEYTYFEDMGTHFPAITIYFKPIKRLEYLDYQYLTKAIFGRVKG